MVFLGKNLNMSIVASIGYCIEVVGKEGQGDSTEDNLIVATNTKYHTCITDLSMSKNV